VSVSARLSCYVASSGSPARLSRGINPNCAGSSSRARAPFPAPFRCAQHNSAVSRRASASASARGTVARSPFASRFRPNRKSRRCASVRFGHLTRIRRAAIVPSAAGVSAQFAESNRRSSPNRGSNRENSLHSLCHCAEMSSISAAVCDREKLHVTRFVYMALTLPAARAAPRSAR